MYYQLMKKDQWLIRSSRALSKAEQNYAQVEKEALAIVYGINNFHQYVHIFKKVHLGDRLKLYQ